MTDQNKADISQEFTEFVRQREARLRKAGKKDEEYVELTNEKGERCRVPKKDGRDWIKLHFGFDVCPDESGDESGDEYGEDEDGESEEFVRNSSGRQSRGPSNRPRDEE